MMDNATADAYRDWLNTDHRRDADKVLAFLNGVRATLGRPALDRLPPDAPRGSLPSGTCPVAQALDKPCGTGSALVGAQWITFPPYVTEFQNAHDARIHSA